MSCEAIIENLEPKRAILARMNFKVKTVNKKNAPRDLLRQVAHMVSDIVVRLFTTQQR